MENIYLNEDQFNALLEYSTSIPTGTTTGKQWKRHVFVFHLNGKEYNAGYVPRSAELKTDYWVMGEYGDVNLKINKVPITWRYIIIKDKEVPNHVNALGL